MFCSDFDRTQLGSHAVSITAEAETKDEETPESGNLTGKKKNMVATENGILVVSEVIVSSDDAGQQNSLQYCQCHHLNEFAHQISPSGPSKDLADFEFPDYEHRVHVLPS